MPRVYRRTSIDEMFDRYVVPEPNSGCWLWDGPVRPNGYGRVSADGRMGMSAHREAYRRYVADIPPGKDVLHSCDVRCCVNPDHLRLGTSVENAQDRVDRDRQAKGERAAAAKLTEDDVRAIRAMDAPLSEIGAAFGVKGNTVWRIKHRETWRHVA